MVDGRAITGQGFLIVSAEQQPLEEKLRESRPHIREAKNPALILQFRLHSVPEYRTENLDLLLNESVSLAVTVSLLKSSHPHRIHRFENCEVKQGSNRSNQILALL